MRFKTKNSNISLSLYHNHLQISASSTHAHTHKHTHTHTHTRAHTHIRGFPKPNLISNQLIELNELILKTLGIVEISLCITSKHVELKGHSLVLETSIEIFRCWIT